LNKWNLNPDIIPVSLLLVFGFAISLGFVMISIIGLVTRRNRLSENWGPSPSGETLDALLTYRQRPPSWLAVKTRNLDMVRAAFGLEEGRLCSLPEGMEGNQKLFIAAPINGWVLVTGSGLPDPADDPDASFKLLADLSRAVGHVQFFSACRISMHHAWIRAEHGVITRGYAWAGTTVWRQGNRTSAEKNLGLACFDYAYPGAVLSPEDKHMAMLNVDKVPLLAARWSLDPAAIDEELYQQTFGIAA
jgi:hypothetical protein